MNTKSNNSVSKVLFLSCNFDKQGIKKFISLSQRLSLLIDQDKDGRTLTNLILLRYCEGLELVK
jgi:hypothetical protein